MIIHFTRDNENFYDVESIKKLLNISRSKVQRELKKQQTEIIKYKIYFSNMKYLPFVALVSILLGMMPQTAMCI